MSERTVEQVPVVAPPETGNGHAAPPRTRRARARAALSRTHVVIAAVAGLVSVGISLLFQFVPALKPDPRDSVGADVAIVAVEPGVSVREWIDTGFRGEQRAEMLRRHELQLDYRGELVYVRVSVDGHKHKDVGLTYAVYGAATQEPVPGQVTFAPYSRVRIDAPSERSIQFLFVPPLGNLKTRDVFIRAQLTDGDGVLAVGDSGVLRRGKLLRSD